MATGITTTRLVGRSAELAQLRDALIEAQEGRPSVFFVAGESGVGKTRLVSELARWAEDSGMHVLAGDCVELGDGELPYAPLVSALRPLARRRDRALDALSPAVRCELGRLLPDLSDGNEPSEGGEGVSQGAVFEALLALLDALGRDAPVLLAIEDVHWADRSTRGFLAFLARSLWRERVLAVVTYRSDEVHRRHPLRPLLAELERDPRTRRVELGRLSAEELRELLGELCGGDPDEALVRRLYARSEGNPLFAEELLAAGTDGGGRLPDSLRDALMLRIERLAPDAQEVLRTLAVGERMSHATLALAAGMEERDLREALREAVGWQIVVADAQDRYTFRHALLREVVVDDLLPGERSSLHGAVARALEATAGEDPMPQMAAAIAHHYHHAGDSPAAFAASLRAAAAAERAHASGEAAALYERALELWDRVPDPEQVSGGDRVDLLVRAAEAHFDGVDSGRAETLLRKASHAVDPERDPTRAASVLAPLARIEWSLNRPQKALETARRAMDLLPADEPSTERATLLSWWANARMLQGRYREAVEAARDALDACRRAGVEPQNRALNALGCSLMALGQVDEGDQVLSDALARARALGRPRDLQYAYTNYADALNAVGRTRDALAVALEGADVIQGHRQPGNWLAILIAELATDAGDWELAARWLPPEDLPLVGTTLLNAALRRAELALGHGDEAAAERHLDVADRLAADSVEPQFHGTLGALLAQLRRRRGDLDGARDAVETALDRLEFCTEDVARLARVAAAGVAVEADRATRARDVGDTRTAREAVARARDLLARVRAAAGPGRPVEEAWLATAEADLERSRNRDDPKAWRQAAEAWDAVQRPVRAAECRLREADAHVSRDEREEAAAAAAAALAVARRTGARWLIAQGESLVARARLRLPGETAAAAPLDGEREPASQDPFGLTPRERQVLALLAHGATNREIAGTLYMAEKTASVHVSRILAKLGVRSRTEAAAVAVRHGVADEALAADVTSAR